MHIHRTTSVHVVSSQLLGMNDLVAVLEASISFFRHLHTISSMKSIGRLSVTTESWSLLQMTIL